MMAIHPTAMQNRSAGLALAALAAFTAAVVVIQWTDTLDGPWLLPLVVAYFQFNLGYLFSVVKGSFLTKGARLGFGAVLLNLLALLAMSLSGFAAIWTALSVCALLASLLGAYLLFQDAKSATA